MTSNCDIGMRVGAFESSDDDETFHFYYTVIQHTENFLETRKLGNFCVFRDLSLILREKRSISYKVP